MSELVTEMIVPGTYIEVRAEGLLSVGAISTGNVGVIGTAEKGDDGIAVLSSLEESRARFGEAGLWDQSAGAPNVHLVRALRYLFENGARTVYARRVRGASALPAEYTFLNEANAAALTLRAKTPGGWANRLQVRIDPVEESELVSNEQVARTNGTFHLSAEEIVAPSAGQASVGSVKVLDQGLMRRYQIQQTVASPQVVQLNPADRTLTFATAPASSAAIRADYWVPGTKLRRVTLRFGSVQEVYTVPSLAYLAERLSDEQNPSKLVDVVGTVGAGLPRSTGGLFESLANGENGSATLTDYRDALDALVEQNIQILLVVGLPFSSIKDAILGHVERTENLGRERIAVVGADSGDPTRVLENANNVADKRVVLVAPGIRERHPDTGALLDLPPFYAAAAVAGQLSSLSPHSSPTNKTLRGIAELGTDYNDGQLKAFVQNRVLALQRKRGVRVVRGVTTDDAAFQQISVRRIVDYAKEGTRQACNQYIGRLNNSRVRENLRVTLDGFLADLLQREFLTRYRLTVTADRPMEIRGEVLVTMDLMPTFSIDYVRVVMNLS